MTAQEMILNFRVNVDKTNSLSVASFDDVEIYLWLNKAQERFVKTRYTGNNLHRVGFEQNQKRMDDLSALIRRVDILPVPTVVGYSNSDSPNSFFFPMPLDYMLSINERADITETNCKITRNVGVYPVTTDTLNDLLNSPFSPHILKGGRTKPLRLMINNHNELITDGNYSINLFIMRYIKIPAPIDGDSDCELREHTHQEIVDMAAAMAIENIESSRWQSKIIDNSIIE
jgi:hypothetical protein